MLNTAPNKCLSAYRAFLNLATHCMLRGNLYFAIRVLLAYFYTVRELFNHTATNLDGKRKKLQL